MILLSHIYKAEAVQNGFGLQLHFDHLKSVIGEGFDLGCGRKTENVVYFLSAELFGVDGAGETQLVAKEFQSAAVIFGITYSCNGLFCAHLLSNKAGEHIKLVASRYGNEHFGFFNACLAESFVVGTAAAYAHYIKYIGYFRHNIVIVVDCNNVVTFTYQAFDNGSTDLAAAGDYNTHNYLIIINNYRTHYTLLKL